MTTKLGQLGLSARDKTAKPFGFTFHHTTPQRRVPCLRGDLLAPLSADDIPPITAEAMASVQAALVLLASLVADPDHGMFMGYGLDKQSQYQQRGREILLAAQGLAGILRVTEAKAAKPIETEPESTEAQTARLVEELSKLPAYLGWRFTYEYPGFFCYTHKTLTQSVFFTPDWEGTARLPIEVQETDGRSCAEHSTILPLPRGGRSGEQIFHLVRPTLDKLLATAGSRRDLQVQLSEREISALRDAGHHVREHMAHQHPWAVRDTAMTAISKIVAASQRTIHVQLSETEITALKAAKQHVREQMAHQYLWETRDAAMTAISKVIDGYGKQP